MDIHGSSRAYESWLRGFVPLVEADLVAKHRAMRADVFSFLRATFYRWCELWRDAAAEESSAARVSAIGDLHVGNFGTWRDSEGRLIWGINDFDEAAALPWTQDLVRLTASAHLTIASDALSMRPRDASTALFEGYRRGITSGGRPFVLEEHHAWLRRIALDELRQSPAAFWNELFTELTPVEPAECGSAQRVLEDAMPAPGLTLRWFRRRAGRGSLGKPRFVAIAEWHGGQIAREAKARVPSAWLWARPPQRASDFESPIREMLAHAVRSPDPTLQLTSEWIVRRLRSHCVKLGLEAFSHVENEARLLDAMGFELANVHLASRDAASAIESELRERDASWLHALAKRFSRAIQDDWKCWTSLAPEVNE